MDKIHVFGDKNAKFAKTKVYKKNFWIYRICFGAKTVYRICFLRKFSGAR